MVIASLNGHDYRLNQLSIGWRIRVLLVSRCSKAIAHLHGKSEAAKAQRANEDGRIPLESHSHRSILGSVVETFASVLFLSSPRLQKRSGTLL